MMRSWGDGVTEARGDLDRDLYGDERLRSLVARLGPDSDSHGGGRSASHPDVQRRAPQR